VYIRIIYRKDLISKHWLKKLRKILVAPKRERTLIMSTFLQFNCLIHDEVARKAIENYMGILQEAFQQYQSEYKHNAPICCFFFKLNIMREKERKEDRETKKVRIKYLKISNYYIYMCYFCNVSYKFVHIFQIVEFVNF